MTTEDLKNAIIDTEEEWIEEALPKGYGRQKQRRLRFMKPALVTAACAVLTVLGILLWPKNGGSITPVAHAYALAEAQYPAMTNGEEYYLRNEAERDLITREQMLEMERKESEAWRKEFEVFRQVRGSGESIKPFLQQAMSLVLSGAGEENALTAPLNLYMALAMLAETTAGETQQEILKVIGADSAQALREQAEKVWRANYFDNGFVKCILGSSLWLSDSMSYRQDCADRLRDSYYASVYRGTMGSEEYDEAFRSWINAQTGNLLEESVAGLKLDPMTVFDLVSTFYFQDKWLHKFSAEENTTGVFHGAGGDTQAEFMHQTDAYGEYFYGELFGACRKSLSGSDAVIYFILPDEGVSMEELLADAQLKAFLTSSEAAPYTSIRVNLTLPKFDISQDRDLKETVRELGVRRVFQTKEADFSPLTETEAGEPALAAVRQGARIIVDEEGVKAAAYIEMPTVGSAMPPEDEIDFILDRPFLFVLRSRDDLPLLAGIVNRP